jgi:hypothetical protein
MRDRSANHGGPEVRRLEILLLNRYYGTQSLPGLLPRLSLD